MRIITDTMYFGNHKFDMELDTGSETGAKQLTIWVAEKSNIDTVPLNQFGVAQLLDALIEPERTRLRARFEEEKCAFQHALEMEIAGLQGPFQLASIVGCHRDTAGRDRVEVSRGRRRPRGRHGW